MNNKKIIEEFEKNVKPILKDWKVENIKELFTWLMPEIIKIYNAGEQEGRSYIYNKVLPEVLAQQKEEILNELVYEIFVAKDGILPLRKIWIKPNEIMEININDLKNKIAEVVGEKEIYRLADVLGAISKNNKWETWAICGGVRNEDNKLFLGLLTLWNLKDNNLDHQSDECKEFLIDLLVK